MDAELNCNICTGIKKITPVKIKNHPGLQSFSYRVGTYSQFKESMYASISQDQNLKNLSVRQDADLSIGLVDSWAMIADVITFYQEKIANEGFLRTATERKSILELARMIGYELNPGVAADTYLAFTLEDSKNKQQKITIDIGTKVQSIPAQGQLPQTFETTEKIEAKPEWNAARPLLTKKQYIDDKSTNIIFKGTNTRLKKGDILAICTKSGRHARYKVSIMLVSEVLPQPSLQQTSVNVRYVSSYSKKFSYLKKGVYVFRSKSDLFGHNAPRWNKDIFVGMTNWNQTTIHSFSEKLNKENGHIYLDNVYSSILPHDLIVLKYKDDFFAFEVSKVNETSVADFSMIAKVTELKLDLPEKEPLWFKIRRVTVYCQPELLELSEQKYDELICGNKIQLNSPVSDLKKDQLVLVTGELSDKKSSELVSEIARIDDFSDENVITFMKDFTNTYKRDTVLLNFNVAPATHGETKQEILGSGDSSKSIQIFALKQKPLTYSHKGDGSESTLEIQIDDVRWHEAPNLLDLGPKDHCYVTRLDENGNTFVIFGDGNNGARPNTGTENIQAKYRSGIGMGGILEENQLTLLLNRPLGVRGVTNSLPSQGAQDPEDSNKARKNAPLKILTMGRLVSLQDFEDYANAFPGIGKSKATWGWDGQHKVVCLTIMSFTGEQVLPDSKTYVNLAQAINDIKDPMISFRLYGFNKSTFNVEAQILVDPDKEFDKIKSVVKDTLSDQFSKDMRQFGQDVTSSEIYSVIQNVDGVLAVDLVHFYKTDESQNLQDRLSSHVLRWNCDSMSPADLLVINHTGVQILEMIK